MAGESAHFGLRHRAPTPAVRPFELPQRLQPMGERAKAALAEPFRGIAPDGKLAAGLFSIDEDRRLARAGAGSRARLPRRAHAGSNARRRRSLSATRRGGCGATSIRG